MSALAALAQPKKHSPLPNSYWVVPGRLAAGEHPGAHTLSDTTDRLQALLFAGVTLFIDLTEEDEGLGYDHLLIYATGAVPLRYVRHAIADHGVPASKKVMREILVTIEQHLAKQGTVYVHCRSGIGRAATVIGCYLTSLGMSGDEAIERLNEMWLESERCHTFPRVPENKSQISYIQNWQSAEPITVSLGVPPNDASVSPPPPPPAAKAVPPVTAVARLDHYSGAMLGMAIGEAFGAQIANNAGDANANIDGSGAHGLSPTVWQSDTAMTWCLAESYLACKGNNPEHQMQRYLEWQRDGKYASDPAASRVVPELQRALLKWEATQNPIVGTLDPVVLDAHTLARTTAVAMYYATNPAQALIEAVAAARPTLQSPLALDVNRVFVVALVDALKGVEKESLLSFKKSDAAKQLRAIKFNYQILQIMDGWWRGPVAPTGKPKNTLAVLQSALWAFERSIDFHEGLILATNSSSTPTSSGAVYGALAGAYYGARNIPHDWCQSVRQAQSLTELAQRLARG